MASSNEHRAIARRRRLEGTREQYQNKIAERSKLAYVAEWEERTSNRIVSHAIQNIAAELRADAQRELQQRRQRLSELLAGDEAAQQREIDASKETAEARAKRLIAHARAHKAAREDKRLKYAEEMYRMRFKLACDDLRTIESNKYAQVCFNEQASQRDAGVQNAAAAVAEKEQWEQRQREGWAEMEKEDVAIATHRANAAAQNKLELETQIADHQALRAELTAIKIEQGEQRQKDMVADAIREREHELAENARKREAQMRIVQSNAAAQQRRLAAERAERAQEMRDLERDLSQFALEQEEEINDKAERCREMEAYRVYLAAKKREEAELEAEIQRMCDADLARANAKRDVEWEREALARERLNQNVAEGRQLQIQQLRERQIAEDEEKSRENQYLSVEALKLKQARERESLESKLQMQHRMEELKMQMQLNNQRLAIEASRARQDERNSDVANREYLLMLEREKASNTEPKRFFGIKNMQWN